jgi:hypothetical protein
MTTARSSRSLLTAGVVLAPFATVALPFGASLVVQAVLITGLVAVHAALGVGRGAPCTARSVVEPGLVLYAAATLLGAVMGLTGDADLRNLAGQLLAVGLLPVAAAGALAFPTHGEAHWLWRGLFAGTAVGAIIQLVWGLWTVVGTGSATRLYLPNSVSIIGPSLMAVVGAAVFWNHADPSLRRWARFAGVAVGLVLLIASVRSLWVVAPAAAASAALMHHRPGRGTMLRAALVALVAVFLAGGVIAWLHAQRVHLQTGGVSVDLQSDFPDGPTADGRLVIADPTPRSKSVALSLGGRSRAWLVTVVGSGAGRGRAVLHVEFADADGRIVARTAAAIRPGQPSAPFSAVALSASPSQPRSAVVRLLKGASGRWEIHAIRLRPLESTVHAALLRQYLHLEDRIGGLVAALRSGDPSQDPTVGFRWTESSRTLEAWRTGTWIRRLAGAGLGSTVAVDASGFDNRGNWVHFSEVNYLHNWYLFLLYKLGVVGAVAMLAAIALWLRRSAALAVSGGEAGTAATAIWLGTLVWSLTSPEIIDFRVAPLLGWMVAVVLSGNDAGDAT